MILINENEKIYFDWIIKSLKELYQNENRLIERKLKQECVNHHFANYIERNMPDDDEYRYVSVDIEYDKNYENLKEMQTDEGKIIYIRPDILIHKRESENQIIALECDYTYLTRKTKEKLIKLKQAPYYYKFTLGISYQPQRKYFLLYYYIAGELKLLHLFKNDFSFREKINI